MSEIHDQIERRMADRGLRYTPGRRAVVAAIVAGQGPESAHELAERLGEAVPLSSLYRSLATLEGAGVLVRHVGTDGFARYELHEWIAGHHHHLVCVRCGTMADVELDAATERRLGELAASVAAGAGYSAGRHGLEIEGVCPSCG